MNQQFRNREGKQSFDTKPIETLSFLKKKGKSDQNRNFLPQDKRILHLVQIFLFGS